MSLITVQVRLFIFKKKSSLYALIRDMFLRLWNSLNLYAYSFWENLLSCTVIQDYTVIRDIRVGGPLKIRLLQCNLYIIGQNQAAADWGEIYGNQEGIFITRKPIYLLIYWWIVSIYSNILSDSFPYFNLNPLKQRGRKSGLEEAGSARSFRSGSISYLFSHVESLAYKFVGKFN